ncbi:hypothetical protein OPT61_g10307 [Boeremia exigua]|uniref:Uncharacterized protein n=1 Tax=Boeremia exigua TaxID=749465 RepID=A0ACC2HQQ9_9PLEO|nr:hypothetical protein OPT61_g10307 [Boeremia exigua]
MIPAMLHSRRKIEILMVAAFMLCGWFVFDARLNDHQPWPYEATDRGERKTHDREPAREGTKDQTSSITTTVQRASTTVRSASTTAHLASTLTQSAAIMTPSPSPPLPDRIIVMVKVPKDDTHWVHELQDWQSAIYDIDIETPHNISTLDPLTNSTLRTLRNKGNEANAYLAYIVQNYNTLPSTIAFLHPHKDGYPAAWHTDNDEYSNIVSLQTLNINFVQSNGYANLRCVNDPGCPQEVMPFRDPPEKHRTAEAAMSDAWHELFNTDVPHVLATPCCAQFAVSSKQVRMRPLKEYKRFYTWLMETPLDDETSGRIMEYLWHVLFGQEPV